MAKKLGNDYLLWIESATAGTFNVVKGQQNLSVSRDAGSIDTTSKDESGYGTSAPGLKSLKISLDMIPNLPDANGYTRLETLCNATPQAPFNIQIRKGASTGTNGDVVFAGSVYGNIDSTDFGQNEAVKAKIGFSAAAAPTTDVLG
ncbi:phage tail tube protein [Sphingomonas sp. BK235]|uniref:phage tail tube protein n=1 Tax=Sphingomonas sp. BK235 TaxID=2512131 RepID=UPI0010486365|nr:phage tail tube protein [Sphingomonas sp. BK235]TCP33274.1 phage tail tube protein [Sphingomonas sp. BK235]